MKEIKLELPIVDLSGVCESMNDLKKAVEEYGKREAIVRLGTALIKSGVKCSSIIEGSDEEVILDFSEHDKKVAEENDERITELERENNSLKEKLSFIRTRVTEEARDFWDKDMFGSLVVTIPKKFSDEVKVSELKKELSKANDIYMALRSRVTADAIEYFVEEKYDRLVITLPENMTNAKHNIELEDRHQSDCIEINRLNVALEVMTEKYIKLREVHGL